ncbi:hypothetical protein [Pseudomonas sp. Root329]|nr:hypothetical protein [Pseudomonas sp. Root329]
MFRWKKPGKVFDPKDLTQTNWMHEFSQSPSVLVSEWQSLPAVQR